MAEIDVPWYECSGGAELTAERSRILNPDEAIDTPLDGVLGNIRASQKHRYMLHETLV